jgi:heat shock protein HtpX
MATFYDLAAENRRKSLLLVLIVVAILAAFGASAGIALSGSVDGGIPFALGAFGLGFLLTLGAFFGGDKAVLAAARAKELDPSAGREELELDNIVNELCLAANMPKPKVYTIDDTALNAFATGRDPEHASIAVTQGLMRTLDREEMSGVIAHELSHVRNFDIRYGLLVAALVGSLALLSDLVIRWAFWGGGRQRDNDRNGGGAIQVIFFVLTILLAILAPIAARLVQLANSAAFNKSGREVSDLRAGINALGFTLVRSQATAFAMRQMEQLEWLRPIRPVLADIWKASKRVIDAAVAKAYGGKKEIA